MLCLYILSFSEEKKKDHEERPDIFGDPVSKERVISSHYLGRKTRHAVQRLPSFTDYVQLYTDLFHDGLIRYMQSSGHATLLADVPYLVQKHEELRRKY